MAELHMLQRKPVDEFYSLEIIRGIMAGYRRKAEPLPVCVQFCRWCGTSGCLRPELSPGEGCPGFKINASTYEGVNDLVDADMQQAGFDLLRH